MRAKCTAALFLLVIMPGAAAGQTLSLHGAAGPTVKYPGHVLSAGAGFSPASRLDVVVNVERIHLATYTKRFSDGDVSVTRGGTMTFASGEVRASLFPADRVSPFAVLGVGGGVSRPNVNAQFPNPVRNNLGVFYFGGGILLPLRTNFSLLADARIVLGLESYDDLMAALPIRIGAIWRF